MEIADLIRRWESRLPFNEKIVENCITRQRSVPLNVIFDDYCVEWQEFVNMVHRPLRSDHNADYPHAHTAHFHLNTHSTSPYAVTTTSAADSRALLRRAPLPVPGWRYSRHPPRTGRTVHRTVLKPKTEKSRRLLDPRLNRFDRQLPTCLTARPTAGSAMNRLTPEEAGKPTGLP